MDDALAQTNNHIQSELVQVLILVVMDDALAQTDYSYIVEVSES